MNGIESQFFVCESLYGINNTKADFPQDKTIHGLFEEQAKKTPNKIAVIYNDKNVTYRELNELSNQVAWLLRNNGVTRDVIVGIMLERSIEMIVGILGILKSGGCYLPIAHDNPEQRVKYIIEDSGARLFLTNSKYKERCDFGVNTINIDDKEIYIGPKNNPNHINHPYDLIYVIYTSGSTGNPKGVMIEHRSVVNRLHWMQKCYPIGEKDTLLQKTSFAFDVSVWELFWWGITGAKVCLLKQGYEKFPQAICDAIEKNEVTVVHFVPSMLGAFLNYIENLENIKCLRSLKRVFASGEALLPLHIKKFNKTLFKHNFTRLTNLYGPTEATVDVTFYDCPEGLDIKRVPIGKPIDNTMVFICEGDGLLSEGVKGELCIGGVGLARGYLNQTELSSKKFVNNPFLPGQKMYRTGDLASIMEDGNIEYIGRMDSQVKIRGLRIELGEIESVIEGYGGVLQCVVVVKDQDKLIPTVTAYIVSNIEISINGLKRYLKNLLPEYMIPNSFVFIDSIPLTANGKIDRTALLSLQ